MQADARKQCDDESVPQVKYSFQGIGDLGELQKDELCGECDMNLSYKAKALQTSSGS